MPNIKLIAFAAIGFLFWTANCEAQKLDRYRTIEDTSFVSKNLGYKKHIQITVPTEYQENLKQNFPLIIFFDMQNQKDYNYMLQTADYLTSNSQMPSSIIIGVETSEHALETTLRRSDPKGLGDKNEAYIFNELIPFAKNNYNAGGFTMLIGHGRYGYFTSYLLGKHLDQLNAVMSINPFLQEAPVNLVQELPAQVGNTILTHTIYYRVGMDQSEADEYQKLLQLIKSKSFVNKNINAEGWLFSPNGHMATPGLTMVRALFETFEQWSIYENQYLLLRNRDVNSIYSLQKTITQHYGVVLPNSLGVLNNKGYAFFKNSDFPDAIAAWQQLVKQYPNFSEGYLNIAKCQRRLRQSNVQAIRDFKTSLEQSSVFTDEEKSRLLHEAEGL
jgi:tetratricopeptide (TPR) repeat protein